jgi:integrating conjugative element protein (TIGR03761 family)
MKNSKPTSEKPMNRLAIEMDIALQTYNAQNYVWGNIKGVLGLFGFARYLTQLNKAASRDDPYADWFLLRIHDALGQARHKLQRLEKRYKEVLKIHKNQQRIVKLPENPEIIKARFVSQYGFIAADMLGDYDRTLVILLVTKFTGIALDKPFETIESNLSTIVESVLNLPLQWKTTQVTRSDVRQNTDKAQQAQDLMGKLPEKILEATLRAQYAPPIKTINSY